MQFPGAAFSPDPGSLGAYDRAHSRWVPVFRAWVAPDGNHYAYTANASGTGPVAGSVHVVDVVTGAERTVPVPAPSNVVSWEAEGIYVVRVIPNSGAPPQGLTLVDPNAGSFRQITADGIWTQVGGGAAWGADVDPAIAPPPGGGPGGANRLRRLDLASGAVTIAGTFPGANVGLLGVLPTGPVYSVSSATTYVVTSPAGQLFSAPISNSNPAAPAVVDGATIWFSSFSSAVWRSDAGGPVQQVATTSLPVTLIAGACR